MPSNGPGAPPNRAHDLDPHESRLAELVRQYARLVRHAIRAVRGRRGANDSEDIEQTVYLNLWQQVRREQVIDHPASYVYRMAVRETVRAVRRLRADREADSPDPPEVAAEEASPEQLAMGAETSRALLEAVRSLQPDRARAVRAHLQGLSVAEIMALYGWSYQKARNLIARGMADLRVALREKGVR
jgi:RNA polymerase sigma factor (sigma-70 family)